MLMTTVMVMVMPRCSAGVGGGVVDREHAKPRAMERRRSRRQTKSCCHGWGLSLPVSLHLHAESYKQKSHKQRSRIGYGSGTFQLLRTETYSYVVVLYVLVYVSLYGFVYVYVYGFCVLRICAIGYISTFLNGFLPCILHPTSCGGEPAYSSDASFAKEPHIRFARLYGFCVSRICAAGV
jgi:hypothetical protein